jgi:signal transduction histidine kinase
LTSTLKNKIDLTFLAVAIVIIVLIIIGSDRAKVLKDNGQTIYESSAANTLLEKILSNTVDSEANARGYLLTGNDIYFENYLQKNKDVIVWMDSLRVLKNGKPAEIAKVDNIDKLIAKKNQFSESTMVVLKNYGIKRAAERTDTNRGRLIMDSIKSLIKESQEVEIKIVAVNLQQTEESIQLRNVLFIGFVLIFSILIFFAYLLIRKTVKRLGEQDEIQKDLIAELSMQNNQLNDFSSIISHNLRAPAANITMLIETHDENSSQEEASTLFYMLKKVSQNLNETLNHLLDILSLKSNKKIEVNELKFEEILAKTIDNLQGEILQKEAKIKTDFSQAPIINYPAIYLESIFHNLVSNALKYADATRSPEIIVSSQKVENVIYLSVQDNGLGIDMTKYGVKLFGMNKVFHEHPDAKGVGLFMTKMQVERFGGKITVKSEVNSGSTFTIAFN